MKNLDYWWSQVGKHWRDHLSGVTQSSQFNNLNKFLNQEYNQNHVFFPESKNIFRSFLLTPFHSLKVVIIGQDPYHGEGQADGLAFSVPKSIVLPPSLRNIFKEINSDKECIEFTHGTLDSWAKQGVLLLNTVLTVRAHQANSHRNQGWELFTDQVIRTISDKRKDVIFVLWGKPAQTKQVLIDIKKHNVLKSSHPSPLSAYRGFLGCGHFKKINEILQKNNQTPINWKNY